MTYRKNIIIWFFIIFLWNPLSGNAQELKLPPASSQQTIIQELGLSKVTLIYSRPNSKGRPIFGGIVPYDLVWRTGASAATTLTFDHEVNIAGKLIEPGNYALFTIPGKADWTVILNKKQKQWGADAYDAHFDALRFEVKPFQLPTKLETFNIGFTEVSPSSLTLSIGWDQTGISFPISINEDQEIQQAINQALAGENKPYFEAAMYYYNTGKDLKKALEWMQLSDQEKKGELYYIKYWKGIIQLKLGDKTAARTSAEEALKLAEKQQLPDYVRMINSLIKKTTL